MMRTRPQEGYLYRKGRLWMLRYYDSEIGSDGAVRRVQKTKRLAEVGRDCPTKAAAWVLAEEYLAPINRARATPQSTMMVEQFVETRYLPFVEQHKRVSTLHGYRNMWKRYLKPHGRYTLRDFRTSDAEQVLEKISKDYNLTSTTMAHIKAFLSGVFRYAKRQGVINSENPIRDLVLPKAVPPGETYAYSLEEINKMLEVMPEPAGTIVASAAFTGARKGELRGFLWENYDGRLISVTQSFWRGHAQEPKTRKSRAAVPVIARLAARLDQHRLLSGNPTTGLMFATPAGKPINLDALVVDVIRPALTKVGVPWHGWHAFRRGLATTLHRSGVPDKTIQAILRHSNVAVTQACYIKTIAEDVTEAMRFLEYAPNMHLGEANKPRYM